MSFWGSEGLDKKYSHSLFDAEFLLKISQDKVNKLNTSSYVLTHHL